MAPKFLPATFIALLSMASAAVASPAAPIAQLVINTPVNGVAQCEPVLITWSGGIPPYVVAVQTNPFQPTPLVDFGLVTGTSLTWVVNATLGASLLFEVTDDEPGKGLQTVVTAPFKVVPGAGSGCINAN